MERQTAGVALVGALAALAVVGVLIALDQTRLHWYSTSQKVPDSQTHVIVTPASPTVPANRIENAPSTPLPDRTDCAAVSGTAYRSASERQWFLAHCVEEEPRPNAQNGAGPALIPTTPVPPEVGAPPSPPPALLTPILSEDEAIALVGEWLIDQGGEWLTSWLISVPSGVIGFLAYNVNVGTCTTSWDDGIWLVGCTAHAYNCTLGACDPTVYFNVFEASLAVSVAR